MADITLVAIQHSEFTNNCQQQGANLKMIPASYRKKDAARLLHAAADNVALAQETLRLAEEAVKSW